MAEFGGWIISAGIGSIFVMILYNWLVDPILSRLADRVSPSAPVIGANSEEAIMAEAKEMLEGWYAIRQSGEIICDPPPEASMDSFLEDWRKPVLYLFAAKDAYDQGKRKTPQVSDWELVENSIPYDPEFLTIAPRSHWIDFYEAEAVELDNGREAVVCGSSVDRDVFELLERDCEILQREELDFNGEVMVVDCGKKDGTPIPQLVFELDGIKAIEAAEYLK